MSCAWHICEKPTEIGRQGLKKFCSKKCKNKYYVDRRRKKLKQMAVDYKGGKCQLCSYDRCLKALQFHHLNSAKKDFGISRNGHTRSWARIKAELDKCALLCSNCHAEVHAGLASPEFTEFSI